MSPIIFKGVNEGDEPMDQVATHQRLLIGAALRTKGPILELGVGWYSTPLLHEVAATQNRRLYTIDNNPYWLAQFKDLEDDHHFLWPVGWWGELLSILRPDVRFGLVFVDHGQPCEREYAARALMDHVDVFVFHDTEEGFAYGYDRVLGGRRYPKDHPQRDVGLGLFRYQWTDRCQKAWTTVASNTIDVTGWFKELPPVEPSIEVT